MTDLAPPAAPAPKARLLARARHLGASLVAYFTTGTPTFWRALLPFLAVSLVLYTRWPGTNYIFDEQEALLANPYVNGVDGLGFLDAIHRDFWGLPATRSVGSYRPIPDMLWRALWGISKAPFFHSFYNVVFHAVNAALLTWFAWRLTRRRDIAWLSGATFVACAVLTEAVSGIVGIADVLGGMGAIFALLALGLPLWGMPFVVFVAVLFGLFCKESALVCVPLIPVAALLFAPLTHPRRPWRLVRALVAFLGAAAAFVLYVELRRRWFLSPLPAELEVPLPEGASTLARWYREALIWFHQAPLPKDPLNNPLAEADTLHRIAGALRVYMRGLGQVLLPLTLSGDYSFPQEPAPTRVVSPSSVVGGLLVVLPLLGGLVLWVLSLVRERRDRRAGEGVSLGQLGAALVAVGMVWVVVSYFPHSNIPVVLPTVRAERFWYFPAIGSSLVIAVVVAWLHQVAKRRGWSRLVPGLFGAFLLFQGVQAYRHAMDYRDDLTFWEATKNAVPNSAKAHLNYSVMKGARGDLETRLVESKIAMELAPKWPMGHIYTGDTLCRLHRSAEAWPHYREGFEIGPNEQSLIALALQCLYDEKALEAHDAELRAIAERHPGSWIAYLAIDTLDNGADHNGVDPQYRPRGYNEGPKKKKTESSAESSDGPADSSADPLPGLEEVDEDASANARPRDGLPGLEEVHEDEDEPTPSSSVTP